MKRFFLIIFLSSAFFACEMDVEVDIPEKPPRLVVTSTLVPWSANSWFLGVEVFSSRHIFDESANLPIDNATVRVYRDGDFFGQLSYLSNDNYSFFPFGFPALQGPLPGETYRVEVSAPGFEPVWAETTIPQPVAITHWNLDRIGLFDEDGKVYSRVSLTFNDPPNQTNYYEIVVTPVDCQYRAACYSNLISFESVITGEPSYPSPVMIDSNGARRLLFKDDTFEGKEFTVNFYYFPGQEHHGSSLVLTGGFYAIQLRHVTEEYYKHFSTLQQARNQRYENILYGMGEPINIFSNITNGFGVFAGFNSSVIELHLNDLAVN
jgi:hypothetical protein